MFEVIGAAIGLTVVAVIGGAALVGAAVLVAAIGRGAQEYGLIG